MPDRDATLEETRRAAGQPARARGARRSQKRPKAKASPKRSISHKKSASKRTTKRKRPLTPKRRKHDAKGSTRATPQNVLLPDPLAPKVFVGRPRKITPEATEQVRIALMQGNYIETSLAFAGLSRQTGYDALRRGRAEIQRVEKILNDKYEATKVEPTDEDFAREVNPFERVYVEFSYMIESTLAYAEVRDVKKLHDFTERITSGAQAASLQWRLERRFRKRWEKSEKSVEFDVNAAADGSVGVKYTEVHGVGRAADFTEDDLENRDTDEEFAETLPE